MFHINSCSRPNCDKAFENLTDLIYHIEDEHIDFSTATMEQREQQQGQCVPLSYVLKFSQVYRKTGLVSEESLLKPRFTSKKNVPNKSSKKQSLLRADTNSPPMEPEINGDTSNDDLNSENLAHYSKPTSEHRTDKKEPVEAKQFVCPIPGCNKRYKNINGIKYHTKNGHDVKKRNPAKARKVYTCHCGKVYKTAQGIKAHRSVIHKDLCVYLHRGHSPLNSPMLAGRKLRTVNQLVQRSDCNTELDEDNSSYSVLNKTNGLSDAGDENGNNLTMLVSPCSFSNNILTDTFADNLALDEASYSFAFAYPKF